MSSKVISVSILVEMSFLISKVCGLHYRCYYCSLNRHVYNDMAELIMFLPSGLIQLFNEEAAGTIVEGIS